MNKEMQNGPEESRAARDKPRRFGLQCFALSLAVAVPVLFTIHPIFIDDLFFHLAGGRWMFEHHQIPKTDPFSWSRAGESWINFEWLFQLVVYGLYQWVGIYGATGAINGLILWFAAISGLIFWLMTRLGKTLGLTMPTTALLVLLAALLARDRLAYFRPEFATMLFGVLSLLLLERACGDPPTSAAADAASSTRREACSGRRFSIPRCAGSMLWLFPPLLWVWSNMHGGFVLGLLLLMIYAVGALIQRRWGNPNTPVLARNAREWKQAVFVAAAAFLVCMINPYGAGLIKNVIWQTRPSVSRALIVEWQPLGGTGFEADAILLWLFKVVFGLGTIGFLLNWRRTNWARLMTWFALAALAWQGRRFTPLFGLMAIPLAAAQWREVRLQWSERKHRLPRLAAARVWSGLALVVALGMVAGTVWRNERWGLGIDVLLNPKSAAEFLQQRTKRETRQFNDMNFAVYQMWAWPQQRTFVDLRNVLFGDEFMREYVEGFASAGGWQRLMKRYDFEMVFISSYASGNAALIRTLSADPQWKRVYLDEVACVFAREPLASELGSGGVKNPNDPAAARRWREQLEPTASKGQRERFRLQWASALYQIGARESAQSELEALLGSSRHNYEALYLLAVMAVESHDGAKAEKYLAQLFRENPARTEGHTLAASVLANSGQTSAALDEIARVTALNPNDVGALLMEAELAERAGDLARAENRLRRAVRLYAFPRPDPYLRLAMVQEKRGEQENALQNYRRALSLWGPPDEEFLKIKQHAQELENSQKGMPR